MLWGHGAAALLPRAPVFGVEYSNLVLRNFSSFFCMNLLALARLVSLLSLH